MDCPFPYSISPLPPMEKMNKSVKKLYTISEKGTQDISTEQRRGGDESNGYSKKDR